MSVNKKNGVSGPSTKTTLKQAVINWLKKFKPTVKIDVFKVEGSAVWAAFAIIVFVGWYIGYAPPIDTEKLKEIVTIIKPLFT